ncbi:MAG: PEP-CTERM sorting domain-containing protein [Phycisphaerae bacterium]|nr:PEP-CTERM sorting domain-containing protein [Phycisphaerae bacterium]
MKTRIFWSLLIGLSLTGLASGSVIFSDDFNLADGSDIDSTKWDITKEGSSVARIDAGTGNGKADLQGAYDGSWRAAQIYSKVGGDFLTTGNTVTYTAKVAQTAGSSNSAAIFGVGGGSCVEFTSWASGNLELKVGGSSVWSGAWSDKGTLTDLTIVLTPTTYDITLGSVLDVSGSHSITSSDGKLKFVSLSIGSGWCHTYVDDAVINEVPEPTTMGLLSVGGLGVLLRRKR